MRGGTARRLLRAGAVASLLVLAGCPPSAPPEADRLQLSPAQFALLHVLAEHTDQICTRDQIVAAVWPDVADGVSDEAIDALVKRVRARLAEAPDGQRYLATLRGRGLILRSPANLQAR